MFEDPQFLVQGGAVGIALLLIWVLYKIVTNHIGHNTEVLTTLAVILKRIEKKMDSNGWKN